MNDALTALAFALLVGAGAFAAHRIWVRTRAVRRLDAEGAELTTSLQDGAIPAWVPAGVGAVVGFSIASVFFGTSVMIALAAGFDLAALVYVGFAVRASSRELRSEQQLGDALRLMTAALRAGASPNDALERAAAQVGAPIGPRLAEAAGKLRLGEDAKEVLGALGRESHLDSLRLFSQALAVQWRAGGSLQRTLTTVGAFVRDRVELQRRIESQIAPTRSSVLILAGATAAVAFLSWSNDPLNIERFVASSVGNLGIAICLGLQGLSFLWMWNLSRFENG
ncbi:MAG: type II secretion system F family protein [Myxococcota bacterium]